MIAYLVRELIVLDIDLNSDPAEMQVAVRHDAPEGGENHRIITFVGTADRVLTGLNSILTAFQQGVLVYWPERDHTGILQPYIQPRLHGASLYKKEKPMKMVTLKDKEFFLAIAGCTIFPHRPAELRLKRSSLPWGIKHYERVAYAGTPEIQRQGQDEILVWVLAQLMPVTFITAGRYEIHSLDGREVPFTVL